VAALRDAATQGVSNETRTKLSTDTDLKSLAQDAGFKAVVTDANLRAGSPKRVSR
jgi:hypothetical protein